MKIVLDGQICSGKNRVIVTRTGYRFPTDRFKSWRDEMTKQIMRQCFPSKIYDKPVAMQGTYTPGDKRKRDMPGMIDALFHVLERCGIVADDSLIEDVTWRKMPVNKGAARLEIELMEKR